MSAALGLYRQTLKAATAFGDYNFRAYALRRARDDFRANCGAAPEATAELLAAGSAQLGKLRRMATVNGMYSTESSVIEAPPKLG